MQWPRARSISEVGTYQELETWIQTFRPPSFNFTGGGGQKVQNFFPIFDLTVTVEALSFRNAGTYKKTNLILRTPTNVLVLPEFGLIRSPESENLKRTKLPPENATVMLISASVTQPRIALFRSNLVQFLIT